MRGDRLKQQRLALGLSQRELASRTHIQQYRLSRLETGKTDDLYGTTVCTLARILGVTTDYLLGMDEAPYARTQRHDPH